SATRLREGDAVLAVLAGSTRSTVVFFSNQGTAYTCRMIDVISTTGYGEPIQKLFKLKDGERIVAAHSLDRRVVGDLSEKEGYYPETYAFAATSNGYGLTFGLAPFAEPSTKAGRRFARPASGAEVMSAALVHGDETVIAVTEGGRALLCPVEEVSYLAGAGKGVLLVRLAEGDRLLVARPVRSDAEAVVLRTSLGG